MKKTTPIFLIFILFVANTFSQTSIKTMFYNLLYYPSAQPSDRELILKRILDTYQPDIFTVCELETEVGADEILTQSIQTSNPNFARAVFVSNQSDSSADNQLNQMLFYNTDKFTLENQQTHTTYIRDIMQYTLLLNTVDQATNPIRIEYFVAHFKSSDGTTNKAIRLDMANVFTAALDNLDPNSYVIFSGDFNLYTSSEDAYQKILDTNNSIVMIDPINDNSSLQSWNNNDTYTAVHTQATRVNQLYGNGAYSGLDDRFDFTFISNNLVASNDLHMVQNSYHAYGNNENCYNLDINDPSCTGNYALTLRDDLYLMSDHLPVVMELETPQSILNIRTYTNSNTIKIIGSNSIINKLTLQISEPFFNNEFTIYNQLGQQIKKFTTSNSNQQTFDISDFSNGFYIITSSNNKLTHPLKFIKVN